PRFSLRVGIVSRGCPDIAKGGKALMLNTMLLSLLLLAAPEKPASYARPDLLVEPADLKDDTARKKYIVLDARPLADYQKCHISGAVGVDAGAWSKAFFKDHDRSAWGKRTGSLGITTTAPVVIYGGRGPEAARVWWILRYWGVKDVRLLNGGWAGFLAAGG